MQHFDDDLYLNNRKIVAIGGLEPSGPEAKTAIQKAFGIIPEETLRNPLEPLKLPEFDSGKMPDATTAQGCLIWVFDLAQLAVSNGQVWLTVQLAEAAPPEARRAGGSGEGSEPEKTGGAERQREREQDLHRQALGGERSEAHEKFST